MIWPRIMPHPSINLRIRVPCPFGPELPYRPFLAVFVVEELDEVVERIAVCALGVGAAGAGGCDYLVCYVAEIEACFWVSGAGSCDDLAEEGCHGLGFCR